MLFSKKEDNYLRRNYLKIPAKRMSKILGRSESGARQRMQVLGLVVPDKIRRQFIKQSQFKKGHKPKNFGQKMSKEVYKKCRKTMFKKGNKPYNTKYDGCIQIRRDKTKRLYKYIRLSEGKWQMLNVYNWEKVNGKVPEGYIVVFKNNDTMNCDISNLELITREENMKRNTIHNYPIEIVKTIRTISKLNKLIKNGKK